MATMERYPNLPESAILTTRFMTAEGVGEVHDFMPVIAGAATSRVPAQHRPGRAVRPVRPDRADLAGVAAPAGVDRQW
jgi:hypothetical protein